MLIAVATLAYFIADGVMLPAIPLYVEGPLGGSDAAVGISVGAFSATALLLRPWAGRLGDRRGRRLLMIAGALLVGLSVLSYVFVGTVAALVALRLVTGVGEAFFFTGAAAAVNDLAPEERRGEAVSFFSLALYVGIGVGPLIGEWAIRALGFDAAWAIAAVSAFLAGSLALWVPETRPEREEEVQSRLLHRAALVPGTVLLATVWGMAGFFAFVPLYALTIDLEGSRFVFVLYSTVVVLIRSFGARIPDILGGYRSSRLSLVSSAVGLAIIGLWRSPAGLLVGTAVFAVGSALAFPALMLLAVRAAPASERGSVVGTFTAFVDLGFGVGPITLGLVAEATGYGGAFLSGALVAAAGLTLLVIKLRPSAHEVASPGPT